MGKFIKRLFHITDKGVDRVGYWSPILGWLAGLFGGGAIMSWIGSQWQTLAVHGWAVVVLFGIATTSLLIIVLSVALASWRYFRPLVISPVKHDRPARAYNEDGSYPNYFFDHAAHESLTNFAVETVIPAGYAQELLQRTIIDKLTDNPVLQEYATRGLLFYYSYERTQFRDGFSELSARLAGSPMEHVPFLELIDCVDQIEKGYKEFCRQTVQLARSSEINFLEDQSVREAWEEWREAHNTLVREYDQVKRESKYGKLYRPQKPSRWGGIISPLPKDEPLPFLLPPDIAEERQR
ncbi:hypothetical protein [Mesorhizobium sp. WSM1293]|uniref:hypothetical protein n=1 Tax=Mesorhizobium sp. WSM1293 TaxID=1040984 RepID=UPI0012EC6C48|nr:hypothetical protein [Mesorhizobium sp. WSM1293]